MSEALKGPLCPQTYLGLDMVMTACTRCSSGWDPAQRRCTVAGVPNELKDLTAEYLAENPGATIAIPDCPFTARCQHALQAAPGLCEVRAMGMVCESALIHAGMSPEEAHAHPDAFNAEMYSY
jgi:hypothetical protein